MSRYARTLLILAVLHIALMGVYLDRVPGLLGDEGSEGENVWQILDTKQLTVYGERSYIGPLIDYVRVPFILMFGYTTLALRIPIVLFSVATFFLAAAVFRKILGDAAALYVVAALFFSPVYLLYQRLGWAITIIPFFALLIIWLLQRRSPYQYVWVGLAAGIGLSNHFIFLPTLTALVIGYLGYLLATTHRRWQPGQTIGFLRNFLVTIVGFMAGFGTQLAVLLTMREDQGDPGQVIELFSERWRQLAEALPAFVSGSVFSAFYTGDVFPLVMTFGITIILAILALIPLFFSSRKIAALWWIVGLAMQLIVLVLIVDRFAARYFVMTALSVWGLAGLGLFVVLEKIHLRAAVHSILPPFMAVLLTATLTAPVFLTFLAQGGSTNDIPISSVRREPAAAFVEVGPLFACVDGRGPVITENVHIYNRLLYASHQRPEIEVTEQTDQEKITVDYRTDVTKQSEEELCPSLTHFQVLTAN